jgi:hypothetical protein
LAFASLKGMGLSVLISNLGKERATFSGQETNIFLFLCNLKDIASHTSGLYTYQNVVAKYYVGTMRSPARAILNWAQSLVGNFPPVGYVTQFFCGHFFSPIDVNNGRSRL